jgi:hypothetical protein
MVSSTTMRFVEESLLRRIKKTQEIQRKDNKEIEKSQELASWRGRKTWVRPRRRRSVKCNPFALDCLGICVLFMLRAPYSVCFQVVGAVRSLFCNNYWVSGERERN